MPALLLLLAVPTVQAKPPGLLKALTASMDPLTGPRATLDALRAQQPTLGPVDGAIAFATAAAQVLPMFPDEERASILKETLTLLDGAIAADGTRRAEVETARGQVLAAVGDRAAAEQAFQASLLAGPSLAALSPLLDLDPAQAPARCASTRAALPPDQVGPLLETCSAHGDALSWATGADRAAWHTWQQDQARAQAELDARHAAEQAELSASLASAAPAPAASAAPAPSGPSTTSVTLRNTCPRDVRLFFGQTPKYGSGTTTTLSSNSVTSYTMKPGDQLWIVDEQDNGLSSTSASGSAQTIEVTPSCTGFAVR